MTSPSSSALAPGSLVDGRYEVVRELGRGGMGVVYEAEQVTLQKRVALKVIQVDPSLRAGAGGRLLKRFLREARVASSLEHRNVVDISDFGDIDERSTYYVMELLEGRDLSTVLRADGPLPWPRAQWVLRQVLEALHEAHAKGIIHRDIKPANIMVLDQRDEVGQEWVKVLDFGIAKVQDADEESQALTGTSEILGTAKYMAPELVTGNAPDARIDLYAVGIVAYQLLTGTAPFDSPSTFQLLMMQMNDPPPSMRERVPTVPPAVEAFVRRALEKSPDARYQTAAQMREALDALTDAVADPSLPDSTVLLPSDAPADPVPGGTVVASPMQAPPAPTPPSAPRNRPVTPAGATVAASSQYRTPVPAPAPRSGSGYGLWVVVIPVLAIVAGIAVGLLL